MSARRFCSKNPKLLGAVFDELRKFDAPITDLHRDLRITAELESAIIDAEDRRAFFMSCLELSNNMQMADDKESMKRLWAMMDDDLAKLRELGQCATRLDCHVTAVFEAVDQVYPCVERYLAARRPARSYPSCDYPSPTRDRERERSPVRCVPFEMTIIEAGFHDVHPQKRLPWDRSDNIRNNNIDTDKCLAAPGSVHFAMGILMSSLDYFSEYCERSLPLDPIIVELAGASSNNGFVKGIDCEADDELERFADQLRRSAIILSNAKELLNLSVEALKAGRHISAAVDTLALARDYTRARLARPFA